MHYKVSDTSEIDNIMEWRTILNNIDIKQNTAREQNDNKEKESELHKSVHPLMRTDIGRGF